MRKTVWFNDSFWKELIENTTNTNGRLNEILSRYQYMILSIDNALSESDWGLLVELAGLILGETHQCEFKTVTPLYLRLVEKYRQEKNTLPATSDAARDAAVTALCERLRALNPFEEIALLERLEKHFRVAKP